ncbi:peroxiredoxin family protein [Kordiimonas aquimaris]|uniref:peroxiredoxin family protein n=1 Tax=Kordiimonas aquimaris TaxID=707591 RepID=UPI0021D09834|nr:peroxiredoxin family protein [Kordiimonas aquimaris]
MKNFKLLVAAVFGLVAISLSSQADEMAALNIGPAIGDVIEMDFAAPDQDGNLQSFETFAGEKGAVVVFFRSAKWCPFCQMQLIDLNTNAMKDIKGRGYGMAAISYDPPKDLARFDAKWKVGFPLLSDDGSKMINALGIRNEEYKEGHYAHGVPHPVIFVLDKDKKVIAKLNREGYRDRPEPTVLIEALDSLS